MRKDLFGLTVSKVLVCGGVRQEIRDTKMAEAGCKKMLEGKTGR